MNRLAAATIALLSIAVAAYAVVAYTVLPIGAVIHPDLREAFLAHHRVVVHLHVFGAAAALLLGPLQFLPRLRGTRPRWHRWSGRVYLVAGVGVGGLSGLVLAASASGGAVARAGFAALAIAWLTTGAAALWHVRRGDVPAHRRWMSRNFALAFAAVTLRLELPAMVAAGVPVTVAYAAVAWLCWLPNLLAVESWLAREGGTSRRSGTAFAEPGQAASRCS